MACMNATIVGQADHTRIQIAVPIAQLMGHMEVNGIRKAHAITGLVRLVRKYEGTFEFPL